MGREGRRRYIQSRLAPFSIGVLHDRLLSRPVPFSNGAFLDRISFRPAHFLTAHFSIKTRLPSFSPTSLSHNPDPRPVPQLIFFHCLISPSPLFYLAWSLSKETIRLFTWTPSNETLETRFTCTRHYGPFPLNTLFQPSPIPLPLPLQTSALRSEMHIKAQVFIQFIFNPGSNSSFIKCFRLLLNKRSEANLRTVFKCYDYCLPGIQYFKINFWREIDFRQMLVTLHAWCEGKPTLCYYFSVHNSKSINMLNLCMWLYQDPIQHVVSPPIDFVT